MALPLRMMARCNASNTRNPEQIWKVTADGEVSVFAEGAPLAAPNGVAIDRDGNIVVVNVGDNCHHHLRPRRSGHSDRA